MGILNTCFIHFGLVYLPCPKIMSTSTAENDVGENTFPEGFGNEYELRKRKRTLFPNKNNNEILSAELLAPLPQGNISRTSSQVFTDVEDETKPFLKVSMIA